MTNSSSWSYADNGFGPRTWHERYKVAKGNLQSPINIESAQAEVGNNVGPIQFQYMNIHNSTITNDGRNLQVTLTRNESVVTGGPLTDRYQLAVIRFHWGNDNSSGSEHSIDGQSYPLEVQLIHWNKDLYKNIGEAMTGENGMCIIALLCQVSDEDNEGLTPIIKLLSRDENKGCFSLEVKSVIDPNEIIRDMNSYWTYQGSLTTPPLSENVTWVISQNIMGLSKKQMIGFRNVQNSSGEPMADHCRPPCPLNDRLVRSCTCVVKSTTVENHAESHNHTVNGTDCEEDEETMNGENGNYHDNGDDSEKALYDQDVYCHANDEELNGADDDAKEDLQDQDLNCRGNDEARDYAEDALEKALYDKNANFQGKVEKSDNGILEYGQELDQLESLNNTDE